MTPVHGDLPARQTAPRGGLKVVLPSRLGSSDQSRALVPSVVVGDATRCDTVSGRDRRLLSAMNSARLLDVARAAIPKVLFDT